jgi:phosphatidylinositol alpha-1,6-mannosyltransferase
MNPEDVAVCAPRMKGDDEFDARHKWKVYRVKPYYAFFWPRWLKLYWQVRKICKQEKIGKIYVHHALPVGYVAYLIKKIPYVVFLHGTDVELATKKWLKRSKLRRVCVRAEIIVVNSEFLKRKFTERMNNFAAKTKVIYPCPGNIFLQRVPDEIIRKTKSQLALEGKRVVLTVARLSEGKGYPHFIRLLPKILEKVPNLIWLIVGDGPKKSEIINLLQKNDLQNVARFIGGVSYEDLPKYYQLSDLFVVLTHPDENAEEGWGTVFMEAAASGLPVVAGRAGGVEEAVQNLVTGLLVDAHQDTSVISAVSDLLREKDYAKKMGEAGRQRVLDEFTWPKQLNKLTEDKT